MKQLLLLASLLAAPSLAGGPRISVGVQFGAPYGRAYYRGYLPPPPPPPAYGYYPTSAPRPGFTWIGGYYSPYGNQWRWQAGYWTRPPYPRARWNAPRYRGGRYYPGYWR